MKRFALICATAAALAACAERPDVDVTHTTGKVQTKSRSEPIFYNGKTYQLDFDHVAGAGVFEMKVSGMSQKQQGDAVAVATSSLGYFACPEGQRGKLTNAPTYRGGQWLMQARCG